MRYVFFAALQRRSGAPRNLDAHSIASTDCARHNSPIREPPTAVAPTLPDDGDSAKRRAD